VEVSGSTLRPKRIFISNDADGVVYDNTILSAINSHTFVVGANRNYNVNGQIS
jgi:hypothetical protein